ncbi:MAG: SpoIIE family protein phosphatase [Spirochaetes bacterium]|jgi:serine phosphatase RsbU (regulator of sigma subunit)|nr:SpoIIE family protein phosphatase [Spirochaetota bacterium]
MKNISVIASLLASIMLLGMAIFVIMKDWRDQINRYYEVYNISGMGILFTMFLTYSFPESFDLTQLNRITQLSTVLFFASLFTMSLVFPKSERRFPFKTTALVLTPAVIVGIIIISTDFSITRAYFKDGSLIREYRFFYYVYTGVAFLYLISGMVNFIRKYLKTEIEVYRLQMRYLFVGGSIAVFFASVCSIILPIFLGYTELYVIGPSIAAMIMTVALFYSVIAYHLMDIKTVIHKTVMYAITSMVILVPLYSMVVLYERGVWIFRDIDPLLMAVFLVIVFILFMVFIQPLIDKMFKRRQYEFGMIIDEFIRDVEEKGDYNNIIRRIVEVLARSLFLNRAFLVLLNDSTRRYELAYSAGTESVDITPVDRASPVIRWFIRNQDMLLLGRIYTDDKSFADIRDDIAGFFVDNRVQLILPIYHERRLLGLLCLGEKESLAGFNPDEIEKLQYFQDKSNGFISTSINYERIMKEQMIGRTIDLSSKILSRTVPSALPNTKNIKFGAFIKPKYSEGTDYFDFIRPGEQGIGVITTDISGVGINSALYSVLLRSAFHSNLDEAPSTYNVMQNINSVLFDYSDGKGGLITAYYFYYDFNSARLMYTNAGYPALEVFRIEKNNFDTLDTEGIPLGYDGSASYGMGRTNMTRGDIGLLYSKTLVNSKNQKGEQFGLLRLRSLVMDNRYRQPVEIAEAIKKSFESFMGLSLIDSDIITILFKIA